jgi:tRNA nucleotidyltransferase (CCA-adding enzyme)
MPTSSDERSKLEPWRRRLDRALERLRDRAGMIPESLQREQATERAAARLRAHAWPAAVGAVLERLGERGGRAYLVGGTVRDVLLERTGGGDVDVATSLVPAEVMARFARVEPIGIEHGTVLVLEGGTRFECTTFRRESGYADARHPDRVEFGDDPVEDLGRRDFTVNALAFDPRSGELLDPHGGARDLERGVLRAVGDPAARFDEDALRPLRAARLAATLGLALEPATAAALGSANERARRVAMERVREEWVKLMAAEAPSTAIELLRRAGLLALWMPELDACAGVAQNRFHAYDVYEHSLRVCDAAPADKPRVRWAALLHDIGKPGTRVIRDGDATFYGHDELGARLADQVLTRFRFANDEREAVVHLVRQHMFDFRREWSDAALRRWLRRVGVGAVADLFDLRIADALGNRPDAGYPVLLEEMRRRIDGLIEARHTLSTRDLAVDGRDVMSVLGLAPGPRVGAALEALLQRVLDHPEENRRERLLELLRGEAGAGDGHASPPGPGIADAREDASGEP